MIMLTKHPLSFAAALLSLSAALCVPACQKLPPAAAPAPKPAVERELPRVYLSIKQRDSLRIRSQACPPRTVESHLALAGWIMPRPGHEVVLTAPVAGYVRTNGDPKEFPAPGLTVSPGHPLLEIEPILGPVERVQLAAVKLSLDNDLAKAKEALIVAESEHKRMLDLNKQGVKGQQDVEQSQAKVKFAQADVAAAEEKLKAFAGAANIQTASNLRSLPIAPPRAGTILVVHVGPGQYVQPAAPLVTLADLSAPLVRVPVGESQLAGLDLSKPATLCLSSAGQPTRRSRADANGGQRCPCVPLTTVPQVDLLKHTADLLYDLGEAKGLPPLPKDRMVTVLLPLKSQEAASVVPAGAVVLDAYGGAWIYLDTTQANAKDAVYERRRVDLGPLVANGSVIRPACGKDERVVVAGAAALWSCEFHVPPAVGSAAVDDDD